MDIGSIQAAVSSLQTVGSIAKSMVDLRDAELIRSKVIELQSAIMDAQTAALSAQATQLGLGERVRQLEAQLAKAQDWQMMRERYELHDVRQGQFVYRLKAGAAPAEPEHFVCAPCSTPSNCGRSSDAYRVRTVEYFFYATCAKRKSRRSRARRRPLAG